MASLSLAKSENYTDEELDKPDDLSLTVENIILAFGDEGECLWKTLQIPLSLSEEEAGKNQRKILLKDTLQQWLQKPQASWKVLFDILSKAPPPGPKIAETIIAKHKEFVEKEEHERSRFGAHQFTANNETFTFSTVERKEMKAAAILQSLDPLARKCQEKMDEVKSRLQKSNEEFMEEVNKGEQYWKAKREEEYLLKLAVAGKIKDIITIATELQETFEKVKKHYTSYLYLEKKLECDLVNAKAYFNQAYYTQLEVRITRLKLIKSSKAQLLEDVHTTLQSLVNIITMAERNHSNCSAVTLGDRKYMLQIKSEFQGLDRALYRIKADLEKYKSLKEQEIQKWDFVKICAFGVGFTGLILAPVTFGASLLLSAGGVAAFAYTKAYTHEAEEAVREYGHEINQCASYSCRIERDLMCMEREMWINERALF